MRLPIRWENADDFAAVALMGPTASGKTSFLLSMMHKNWRVFQGIWLNGKPVVITSAQYTGYGDAYDKCQELAGKMCTNGGTCPEGDKPEIWKQPVFLRVEYNGKILILGIYDNAGENLAKPDMIGKQAMAAVNKRTFAEIYLFDPRKDFVGIDLPPEEVKADGNLVNGIFKNCTIPEIDEQGKMQQDNKRKYVLADKV